MCADADGRKSLNERKNRLATFCTKITIYDVRYHNYHPQIQPKRKQLKR
jgi:hypothetical protein